MWAIRATRAGRLPAAFDRRVSPWCGLALTWYLLLPLSLPSIAVTTQGPFLLESFASLPRPPSLPLTWLHHLSLSPCVHGCFLAYPFAPVTRAAFTEGKSCHVTSPVNAPSPACSQDRAIMLPPSYCPLGSLFPFLRGLSPPFHVVWAFEKLFPSLPPIAWLVPSSPPCLRGLFLREASHDPLPSNRGPCQAFAQHPGIALESLPATTVSYRFSVCSLISCM